MDVIGLFDEFEGGWKHAIMNQMDQDKADVDGSSTYSHQTATRNDEVKEPKVMRYCLICFIIECRARRNLLSLGMI